MLFLTCRNEFWRPRLRVLSEDFLFESIPSSNSCRAVDAFSWPRPISIEGISTLSSFQARLEGLGARPPVVNGLEKVEDGAMTAETQTAGHSVGPSTDSRPSLWSRATRSEQGGGP